MKLSKSTWRKALVVLSLLFVFENAQTQNPLGPIIFETNVDDTTDTAPIDGFLGIAMAVGAYFGVRKLRKRKQ